MRGGADASRARVKHACVMTFIWFVVWLIANNVGGHEPLLLSPVNAWAATLVLAVALDVNRQHAFSHRRDRDATSARRAEKPQLDG